MTLTDSNQNPKGISFRNYKNDSKFHLEERIELGKKILKKRNTGTAKYTGYENLFIYVQSSAWGLA